ncbi:MAG TPA: thioredoxin domain-containing protein, partial [Candidatus Krumholzibacterium sp.]|nr:thioredoxin domain-containing protein [Candidatus Krumholzibacterium sp.]
MDAKIPHNRNRLVEENSPYLLQHSGNPVDWYPWTEEAFDKAKEEDKPVFVSIGYSTCHWCHVMERESFENEAIAGILNDRFISVKVDREERPDIDDCYMKAVTAITGSGGWPLTVFLTPGGEPFFGGTYFPPEDRYGRPGFRRILLDIADSWENDRSGVDGLAGRICGVYSGCDGEKKVRSLDASKLTEDAYRGIVSVFDGENGGFGIAPKFPQPAYLSLLLRQWYRTGSEEAMSMFRQSLDHMAAGGIRDHLGGGFHRYTVDASWTVPHFEKMLYDQALLAQAYTQAFVATGEPLYEKVARSILDYVIRDMSGKDGGYFSAEDADSGGMEGGFYLWTPREIEDVLGRERGRAFASLYGVTEGGNFEEGRSILDIAGIDGLGQPERSRMLRRIEEETGEQRIALLERRNSRERPFLDDKMITAWNGLMISAMASAGNVFKERRYIESAIHAAAFVRSSMHGGGKLRRYSRNGIATGSPFLDDYAFMALGFIDLYRATSEKVHLSRAEELAEIMIRDFADDTCGGFYLSDLVRDDVPGRLPVRMKPHHDGALPSANSVAAEVLHGLGELLDEELYRELAYGTVQAFSDPLEESPAA